MNTPTEDAYDDYITKTCNLIKHQLSCAYGHLNTIPIDERQKVAASMVAQFLSLSAFSLSIAILTTGTLTGDLEDAYRFLFAKMEELTKEGVDLILKSADEAASPSPETPHAHSRH